MIHVASAWFRREDYERFRALAPDGAGLPAMFDEWEKEALRQLAQFSKQGIVVEKIVIDPDQFVAWCRTAKIEPNQKARTQYAVFRLQAEKPDQA